MWHRKVADLQGRLGVHEWPTERILNDPRLSHCGGGIVWRPTARHNRRYDIRPDSTAGQGVRSLLAAYVGVDLLVQHRDNLHGAHGNSRSIHVADNAFKEKIEVK